MSRNSNLIAAKRAKNDEFYTQYEDIEAEMNAYVELNHDVFRNKTILLPCDDPEWSNFTRYFASNFKRFGLKKLISTSYAKSAGNKQTTRFESDSPLYSKEKHDEFGKLFVMEGDTDGSGIMDVDDIRFEGYLEGDGDFRSEEVTKLRDEADVIITNPPFSLFREFLAWILEGNKKFVIIGNQNAITYKEVFPLIKDNKVWLGQGFKSNSAYFYAPEYEDYSKSGHHKEGFIYISGITWFTNIDHVKRHEPLLLETMENNLKYNKKLRKKLEKDYGKIEYPHYDNYDAIEVPFTICIPSDYDGVMGVPITFLDKYDPEQFEIVGATGYDDTPCRISRDYKALGYRFYKKDGVTESGSGALRDKTSGKIKCKGNGDYSVSPNGEFLSAVYSRVFIRPKKEATHNENNTSFKVVHLNVKQIFELALLTTVARKVAA